MSGPTACRLTVWIGVLVVLLVRRYIPTSVIRAARARIRQCTVRVASRRPAAAPTGPPAWLPTRLAGSGADLVQHSGGGVCYAVGFSGPATVAALSFALNRTRQTRAVRHRLTL
jgi:hypothetical protein